MCFATAAAVSAIAGAGITAGGKVEEGAATANSANYAAQVAANNAAVARNNAAYAEAFKWTPRGARITGA
jgi:hypothetical protein